MKKNKSATTPASKIEFKGSQYSRILVWLFFIFIVIALCDISQAKKISAGLYDSSLGIIFFVLNVFIG